MTEQSPADNPGKGLEPIITDSDIEDSIIIRPTNLEQLDDLLNYLCNHRKEYPFGIKGFGCVSVPPTVLPAIKSAGYVVEIYDMSHILSSEEAQNEYLKRHGVQLGLNDEAEIEKNLEEQPENEDPITKLTRVYDSLVERITDLERTLNPPKPDTIIQAVTPDDDVLLSNALWDARVKWKLMGGGCILVPEYSIDGIRQSGCTFTIFSPREYMMYWSDRDAVNAYHEAYFDRFSPKRKEKDKK